MTHNDLLRQLFFGLAGLCLAIFLVDETALLVASYVHMTLPPGGRTALFAGMNVMCGSAGAYPVWDVLLARLQSAGHDPARQGP